MTAISDAAGESLLIQIGDGGGPETFATKCMVNTTRGYSIDTAFSEAEIADCSSPSNPAFIRRRSKSVDFSIDGAGTFDSLTADFFDDWALSGLAKNIRVNRSQTHANGGSYLQCAAFLASWKVTGAARDTMTATLSFKSTGAVTRVANA